MSSYLQAVRSLIEQMEKDEAESIREAASLVADCIAGGGIVHIFGSGHSHMLADEGYMRAGTITAIKPLWADKFTDTIERVEGVAEPVAAKADLRPGDVMFVVSNSGRNPLPIEMAMSAKQRGLPTIAITSRTAYAAEPSLHSSGKHLWDVVDVVLDTHVPLGDAVLQIEGLAPKVGPTSTVMAVSILQAVLVEATRLLVEANKPVPIRVSVNLGGEAHNAKFREMYGNRIPGL